MIFYVYEWFNVETNEIFYVGKGCKRRYLVRKHNSLFNEYIKTHTCKSRIIKYYDSEEEAFKGEFDRVNELRAIGQCVCNIISGGAGGSTKWWTNEIREQYSKNNVMKSQTQRERMSKNNPMKNKEVAEKTNSQKRKKVVIGDNIYNSLTEASEKFGVTIRSVTNWIDRGYSREIEPCYFLGDTPKPIVLKTHITTNRPILLDGIYFNSIKDGAEHFDISVRSLSRALNLHRPKCKGHTCGYANQQPSCGKSDYSTTKGSKTNG